MKRSLSTAFAHYSPDKLISYTTINLHGLFSNDKFDALKPSAEEVQLKFNNFIQISAISMYGNPVQKEKRNEAQDELIESLMKLTIQAEALFLGDLELARLACFELLGEKKANSQRQNGLVSNLRTDIKTENALTIRWDLADPSKGCVLWITKNNETKPQTVPLKKQSYRLYNLPVGTKLELQVGVLNTESNEMVFTLPLITTIGGNS